MTSISSERGQAEMEPPASRGEIGTRIAVVGAIAVLSMWVINQEASQDDPVTDIAPEQNITLIQDNK